MDYLAISINSLSLLSVFGFISGLLSVYAFIPYIVDTANNKTHPQRASWLIWSVLGSIAFFSQLYEGAGASLWFAAIQVSGTIVVFFLSIWRGSGTYLRSSDYWILGAALIGLILWYFTEDAAYALLISICISLLGGCATVVKAFRDPDSETASTWVVFLIASIWALFSVGEVDFVLLAYPLYLTILCSAIVTAIFVGRLAGPSRASDLAIAENN